MPLQKLFTTVIVFAILISGMLLLSANEGSYFSHTGLDLSVAAVMGTAQAQGTRSEVDEKLVNYILELVNNDRENHNLPPLNLSNNRAAQTHADELFAKRSQYPSHWSADGMKPYMKYSKYNGTGYVEQNVAVTAFDNITIEKCKQGDLLCHRIGNPPYEQILQSERKMVYNDSICCQDRHKKNIIDKHHTDVSIGISYGKYYFVVVQNFENNYINFTKLLTTDNSHIEIEGNMKSKNYDIENVGVYYDNVPTIGEYQQNKNSNSYELGKLVALVVKPAPLLTHYKQPSNYTLIEADIWSIKDQQINIHFDLSPVVKTNGVYTIVIYLKDKVNGNKFPVTAYSVFRR